MSRFRAEAEAAGLSGDHYGEADRCAACDAPERERDLRFWWAPGARRCPHRAVSDGTVSLLRLFDRWRALRVLPYRGGMRAQPLWLVDAFVIVAAADADAERLRKRRMETAAAMAEAAMRVGGNRGS